MHFEEKLEQEIESHAQTLHVPQGSVVMDFGQKITVLPIVVSGCLKISRIDENGKELFLYYINANESCALTFSCCIKQYPSEIRAVAEEASTLKALPVFVMDDWLKKYPTWRTFVMDTIHIRFNELLQTIDQVAFQKLDERLIQYLRKKSIQQKNKLLTISHEQIATELATSRVVISRLLKNLEDSGKIILFRNQIRILKEL